jgi:hypothetical protein
VSDACARINVRSLDCGVVKPVRSLLSRSSRYITLIINTTYKQNPLPDVALFAGAMLPSFTPPEAAVTAATTQAVVIDAT